MRESWLPRCRAPIVLSADALLSAPAIPRRGPFPRSAGAEGGDFPFRPVADISRFFTVVCPREREGCVVGLSQYTIYTVYTIVWSRIPRRSADEFGNGHEGQGGVAGCQHAVIVAAYFVHDTTSSMPCRR